MCKKRAAWLDVPHSLWHNRNNANSRQNQNKFYTYSRVKNGKKKCITNVWNESKQTHFTIKNQLQCANLQFTGSTANSSVVKSIVFTSLYLLLGIVNYSVHMYIIHTSHLGSWVGELCALGGINHLLLQWTMQWSNRKWFENVIGKTFQFATEALEACRYEG